MAHPGAGVKTLADLKGHPILISDASITAFWVWLKAKYGLNDSQVRKYTDNSAPFLADPRVVQEGYVTSEPYTIEKQAGFKPVVMLLADEGYPGYASLVLAGDAFAATTSGERCAPSSRRLAGRAGKSYLRGRSASGGQDDPEEQSRK